MEAGGYTSPPMPTLADAGQIETLLDDLAEQIRRATAGSSAGKAGGAGVAGGGGLALVGIRRRGDVLAERLAERLGLGKDAVGSIDITLYRDDLSETGPAATVGGTHIPFEVAGRDIVICDDVLMTGRSVLAAIREILDFGRPKRLRLAVLVERPERELPIRADHAALHVSPGPTEKIDVRLIPQDNENSISINTRA